MHKDKTYHSILLALFHDVPELETGDFITPVKSIISKYDPGMISKLKNILLINLFVICLSNLW
jgi:5'-deoxynucleotidase YfbR-like HD superfamily hydrolase